MSDAPKSTDALRADAYRRLLLSLYYNRRTSPSTLRMMVEETVETLGDHGDLPQDDQEMVQDYAHQVSLRHDTPVEVSDKRLRVRAYTVMDRGDRLAFLNWLHKDVALSEWQRDLFADLRLASLGVPTDLGRVVADGIFKRLSKADRDTFGPRDAI